MPASQEQKVDFLLKKIGYSASKTGIAEDSSLTGSTKKAPFAEAIPSPLIIPKSSVWSDSGFIPTTPPTSNTTYVGIYTAANAYRMTYDNTVGAARRSFIARSTYGNQTSSIDGDWIDTQFGAEYIVKVYKNNPGIGTEGVDHFNLQQAGNAGDDGWFFDYSSGVLNFNGDSLPSGIGTDNVYILGYRYTGAKGLQPPAGIGTFHDLVVHNNFKVGGISTFTGNIDANGNLDVEGTSTLGSNVTVNGRIVGIQTNSVIPFYYDNVSDFPSAATYHGAFAHAHNTGKAYFAHAGWKEIVSKEATGIVGTGTERYNIGALDATSLRVTGITTLGSIGISTGRITGPSVTYIDPATVGAAGTVVILGNLQVDGTQTTVNSSVMTVTDKNIEVAKGAANDAAADGAGITVDAGSNTDKTWQWLDATDSWTSSEHIRIPDGKVFGFASDTNTHIGRPAADSFGFTMGGTEFVRIAYVPSIAGSGIGINRTSIGARLHIQHDGNGALRHMVKLANNGAGQGTGAQINMGASTADEQYSASIAGFYDNPGTSFIVKTAGTYGQQNTVAERLRVQHDGKVGIGTGIPTSNLDVRGASSATISIGLQGISYGAFACNSSSNILYAYNGNDIIFSTHAGGGFGQKVTIKNDGKLGIGSATPTAELDVVGQTNLDNVSIAGVSTFAGDLYIAENIIHTGDTDTKISFPSNDTIKLETQTNYIIHDNSKTVFKNNIRCGDYVAHRNTDSLGIKLFNGGTGNNNTRVGLGAEDNGTSTNHTTFNVYRQGSAVERVNIDNAGNLNAKQGFTVAGISTFTGAIGANGDLDVDGHTELDDVNVSGITTSALLNVSGITTSALLDVGNLTNGRVAYVGSASGRIVDSNNLRFDGTNLFVSGINVTNPGTGITSILGADIVTRNLKATGLSTFVGQSQFDSNVIFNSTISAGSTTGTDGYYLKSVGTGVTWAAFPSSRTGLTTTATAGQTTFNFSYNIGFVDVFVNGVKLPASEFTASNGSTIVLDDAAFANDTLEFISLNTLPVTSSGGAQNLTGLADVTISGTPVAGDTLQHNGSVFVNDYTVTSTKTSTSQASIHSLAVATYRSVEYTVQITEGTKYHVTKILAIHNGTNVTFNEYGTLTTHSSLATFALDINSGNMRLLATPASSNSTVFKVKFNAIKV